MAVVLVGAPLWVDGDTPPTAPPTTPLPSSARSSSRRDLARRSARLSHWPRGAPSVVGRRVPRSCSRPTSSILALFAASLQLLMGTGGMASFGHAAYFGIGAYAAALATKRGVPMEAALALSPAGRCGGALVIGWFCVRLSGVYLAMLTLAFAQIVWSIAFQWDAVTGGSNGIVGVWPAAWLAGKQTYYWFTLAFVAAALVAIAWIAMRRSAIRCALAAIRRCGPKRSASTCARHIGRRSCSPAPSPGSPAASMRFFEGQHLAGDARDPSLRRCAGDGARSAASTRWRDRCWARPRSPGSPTRSRARPNIGMPGSARRFC